MVKSSSKNPRSKDESQKKKNLTQLLSRIMLKIQFIAISPEFKPRPHGKASAFH